MLKIIGGIFLEGNIYYNQHGIFAPHYIFLSYFVFVFRDAESQFIALEMQEFRDLGYTDMYIGISGKPNVMQPRDLKRESGLLLLLC